MTRTFSRAYQCATQDDLWEVLTEEAHRRGVLDLHVSVKRIMDTWTLQTGFPVVNVIRDYESNSFTISQVRNFRQFILEFDDTRNILSSKSLQNAS